MNIVLFGEYTDKEVFNGPEKFTNRLFENLSVPGNTVTLIGYFQDGTRYSLYKKLFGYEILSTNPYGRAMRLGVIRMIIFLAAERIDVVHILHFLRYPVLAFLFSAVRRFPVVQTIHCIQSYEYRHFSLPISSHIKKVNLRYERFYNSVNSKMVFVSRLTEELFRSTYRRQVRCDIIYLGIDQEFHEQQRKRTQSAVPRCVIMVESGRKEKGLHRLLSLLHHVAYPIELFIISDTVQHPTVTHSMITVHYHQRMTSAEYAEFLADKEYYLLLSDFETFSIAAAEAMSCGVVPVISQFCGIKDFVRHGENGLQFDLLDPMSLPALMEQYVAGKKDFDRLSANAAETFRVRSWHTVAEEYQLLYHNERKERYE